MRLVFGIRLKLGPMQQNLPPDAARALIFEHIAPFRLGQPRASESVPLRQALSRILAHDVASPLDLPPFDNSAVDGYAVRAADLDTSTQSSPLALLCSRTIAAARTLDASPLEPSQCARIMTGAPVPAGANAIVMREDVDESDSSRILFAASTCSGQNIRLHGEDIKRGDVAVQAGTRLRASEIALLAACGLGEVEVAPRPRVAIIVTGDELAEPGQALEPGQIYNSNAASLEALCQECGAQVVRVARASDDARGLASLMLEAGRDCDVLLTSGGVSQGDFDPVRDVLLGAGELPRIARPWFWKAAIKPGRPILFATLDGEQSGDLASRRVPIFALPGNPVSVAVTFELFVRPVLLRMQGASSERRVVHASVDRKGSSPAGKTEFVRAQVNPDTSSGASGNLWRAQITGAQGSGRLTTMARANALLVIPPGTTSYEAGEMFEARLLD